MVDEIPSAEAKRPVQSSATKSLSETLVTDEEPVTEKSQSPTSTPLDEVRAVEQKRISVSPEAAPIFPEADAREAEQDREELKKQEEKYREKLKKQEEQRREKLKKQEEKYREELKRKEGKR